MPIESKQGIFLYICQPHVEQHHLPRIFKMAVVNRKKRMAMGKLWYLLSLDFLKTKEVAGEGKDRVVDEKKK